MEHTYYGITKPHDFLEVVIHPFDVNSIFRDFDW